MQLPRTALAAATLVVAVLLALAVPVSQLRTFTFVTTCCCPDPADCHCPPAPVDDGKHDAMKRCHNLMQDLVGAVTPAFVPLALAVAPRPERIAAVLATPIANPHAPPAPARPDAPS